MTRFVNKEMNKLWDLIKETYKGKSIMRILTNWKVFENCRGLEGIIIDLGAGKNASYKRYWQICPSQFVRVDIDRKANPDIVADLNKPLPLESNFADVVFLFSVVYIIKEPERLIKEIFRVVKPKGKLFIYSPLIFNESREPDDYLRFTSQGLERLLLRAGFNQYEIVPVGGRFTAALYLIEPIIIFKALRLFFRFCALLLDKIYPKKLKRLYPCSLGYFVRATK